jgi:hypothetical protein
MQRLTGLFGPLIFCTATMAQNPPSQHQQQIQLQKQQMQGEKSMIAEGSAVIQSGAVTGTGGNSLYQGNVQVDPLCAPQAAQALRMLLDHWPRVSKLAKSKKICAV